MLGPVLVACFVMTITSYTACSAISGLKYCRSPNSYLQASTISESLSRSLSSCAASCSNNPDCESFNYDKMSGTCTHLAPVSLTVITQNQTHHPSTRWYSPDICEGMPILAGCDDCYAEVDISAYPIPFFGTPYEKLQVSSNGYIVMGSDLSKYPTGFVDLGANHSEYGPLLIAYNDDFDLRTEGVVYARITSDGKILEAEGQTVCQYLDAPSCSFSPISACTISWVDAPLYGMNTTTAGTATFGLTLLTDGSTSYAHLSYSEVAEDGQRASTVDTGDLLVGYCDPNCTVEFHEAEVNPLNLLNITNFNQTGHLVYPLQ